MDRDPFFPSHSALELYDNAVGDFYLPSDAPKDGILNAIRKGEVYQVEILEEMLKHISVGATVIDVGANIGQMSLALSNMVGRSGKVVSIEADPYLFYVLNKNIVLNKAFNVVPVCAATWRWSGELLPYPEPDLSRFDSLGSYGITPESNTNRVVTSWSIDDMFIDNVSLIKLDIQGSELQTLMGLVETIENSSPAIIVEYETLFDNDFDVSWKDYEDFIESIGYVISKWITPENFVMVAK